MTLDQKIILGYIGVGLAIFVGALIKSVYDKDDIEESYVVGGLFFGALWALSALVFVAYQLARVLVLEPVRRLPGSAACRKKELMK